MIFGRLQEVLRESTKVTRESFNLNFMFLSFLLLPFTDRSMLQGWLEEVEGSLYSYLDLVL